MEAKDALFVCVSVCAVMAVTQNVVLAAPTISCSRDISFGRILPNCNGNITVKATASSGTVNNGCHTLIAGAIQPAICTVATTLATAAQNVRVTFSRASVTFSNSVGAGRVTYDQYLIQTASGSQANTHTFAAALVNPSHVFKVGGRLRFSNPEPAGTYDGTLQIIITSIP